MTKNYFLIVILILLSRSVFSSGDYSTGEILIEEKKVASPVDSLQTFKVEKVSQKKIQDSSNQTLLI